MSDYCRYCDSDQIEERIEEIKRTNRKYRDWDDSDVQELFEDEIGLCYECTREEDADDYKGEGWGWYHFTNQLNATVCFTDTNRNTSRTN